MAGVLGPNNYGKAEVRLVRVGRDGAEHTLTDLNVSVAIAGDLTDTHETGDNRAVLPTDTQKNTVYAFAREPKWILSHIFVLTMVVVMINLGLWQINRLHEKRDRNADVTARTDQPVAEVADLAEPGDFDGATTLEFRRATATDGSRCR